MKHEIDKPTLYVDLSQALQNLDVLKNSLGPSCKVRLSTKSIRCPKLLKKLSNHLGDRSRGVMCFHPDEIPFLFEQGFEDILLAYPVYNRRIADRLAGLQKSLDGNKKFYLMVDLPEHVDVLSVAAQKCGVRLRVLVDFDVSTRLPGLHFGVHRSSIHTVEGLVSMAKKIQVDQGLRFSGVMTYEAQIAGVADRDPREPAMVSSVKRVLKERSRKAVRKARKEAMVALKAVFGQMDVLNGGGSGSVATTGKDVLVNEVTIGSGILCPALFEHYDGLDIKPAIAFGLPVIRRPEKNISTLFAGGYIASGSMGKSKQPRMLHPKGWVVTANEGFGEVQTPIKKQHSGIASLELGQICFFSPAKSGECMERFEQLHLTEFDTFSELQVTEVCNTYRGHGVCFG